MGKIKKFIENHYPICYNIKNISNKGKIIMEKTSKIFQKLTKKNEPKTQETFVYAIDWFKSTKNLKTYDECLLSLMNYCSYIDKEKTKVAIYFIDRQDLSNLLYLTSPYKNFEMKPTAKETVKKMDSQKYDAYRYFRNYGKVMKTITQKDDSKIIKGETFGSKK